MKILLFGKNGQLGWELQRSLAPLGEVIAFGSDAPSANFSRPTDVGDTIRSLRPQVIVNAAAYTAVDRAESEAAMALAVNATTPGEMARAAVDLDALLIHFSTDYVFDGAGAAPWRESDETHPVNEYGRTKLAGEHNIRAAGCKHLIFRTSWVYASRGVNFAKTMLKLAQERDSLRIICDQVGVPTGADLLADITAHTLRAALLEPEKTGTYHVAPAGETTWYDYARHVIKQARAANIPLKVADRDIFPVLTGEFPTPARRPFNSRLNTTKLRDTFGLHLPPWHIGVDRMLAETFDR